MKTPQIAIATDKFEPVLKELRELEGYLRDGRPPSTQWAAGVVGQAISVIERVSKRKGSLKERFYKNVDRTTDPDGCWNWIAGVSSGGYGKSYVGLQSVTSHRMAWLLEKGPIPDNLFVLHKCDNRRCVRVDHLFLGTPQDNVKDCVAKGRFNGRLNGYKPGEAHWRAKLTEADVVAIRASEESHKEVALRLGMSRAQIADIRRGKAWAHVPMNGR